MFIKRLRDQRAMAPGNLSGFRCLVLLGGLLFLLSACAEESTPEPTPNLQATAEARMSQQATQEAIEARVREWTAQRRTPEPGETPSAILSVPPVPAAGAAAAEPVQTGLDLAVGNATGAPGRAVTVEVTLDSNSTPVRSVQVNLSYDGQKLTGPVGGKGISLPPGWVFAWNSPGHGDLRFLTFDFAGDSQPIDGVVFTATFIITGNAPPGDIPIHVALRDVRDQDNKALGFAVREGTVTVAP